MPKVDREDTNQRLPTKRVAVQPSKTAGRNGNDRNIPVLERISDVVYDIGGMKFNVYGDGKTGKTRFACTFPKPLLIIGTEDGTKSVTPIPGLLKYVRIYSSSEYMELMSAIPSMPYVSICLDTAGGLQRMITQEVLGLPEVPTQNQWGMTNDSTWGMIGNDTIEKLKTLLDFSDRLKKNIVIIAHERSFNENSSSDLMKPKVGSALTPMSAQWLNGACDYVCQMFIREGTQKHKESLEDGSFIETEVATGKPQYCLRTLANSVYRVGFRMPESSGEPPPFIPNPTYEKVLQVIKGEYRS